jgi:hypothetical protein
MPEEAKRRFPIASVAVGIASALFWYALARFRGLSPNLAMGLLIFTVAVILAISITIWHMRGIKNRSYEAESPQPSVLRRLWHWRHAGEDGALTIFSSKAGPILIVLLVALIAAWFLFPKIQAYPLILGAIGLVVALRTLADSRRAIIFTSAHLIYRPPFGPPVRIPLKDIIRVEDATAVRSFALRPRIVNGIALTLSGGETHTLPLDFEGGPARIKEQLRTQMKAR